MAGSSTHAGNGPQAPAGARPQPSESAASFVPLSTPMVAAPEAAPLRQPAVGQGARVRVVAPSGRFDHARFEAGCAFLREAGYDVQFDPGLPTRGDRYLAGDDATRLAELQAALDEPGAGIVWMARGGYGLTRLLPHLRWDGLRQHPKWLVGFSDATALHAQWQAQAGLCGVHGPVLTNLSSWSDGAREQLFTLLSESDGGSAAVYYDGVLASAGAHAGSPSRDQPSSGVIATGRLAGGNLTVLTALAGTASQPDLRGCLVLLEDVGERPYRLDRSVHQLLQSGMFDGVRGFVLGQFTDCHGPAAQAGPGGSGGDDGLSIVTAVLAGQGVPVVTGMPFGHEPEAQAVVLGASALLRWGEGGPESGPGAGAGSVELAVGGR